eukprot:2037554-Rhodomonas_salina.3
MPIAVIGPYGSEGYVRTQTTRYQTGWTPTVSSLAAPSSWFSSPGMVAHDSIRQSILHGFKLADREV